MKLLEEKGEGVRMRDLEDQGGKMRKIEGGAPRPPMEERDQGLMKGSHRQRPEALSCHSGYAVETVSCAVD